MGVSVSEILNGVRAQGADTPPETITYLGLLLEREAMSRYGDPIYERLYFPPGWLDLKLTEIEFIGIVDVLAWVLDRHPKLASGAAFALGKTYSDVAVPKLIAGLERYWSTDDEITYQLLIALDNYGLERATAVVEEIAQRGLPKSRAFASDLLRLERKLE